MTLFDVDKGGVARGKPHINQNDKRVQRAAHNTLGTTYRQDTDVAQQRIIFKNGLILTIDNDNKVSSAYGYIPELSDVPVLIIAKDGYDVFEDILGIEQPKV